MGQAEWTRLAELADEADRKWRELVREATERRCPYKLSSRGGQVWLGQCELDLAHDGNHFREIRDSDWQIPDHLANGGRPLSGGA